MQAENPIGVFDSGVGGISTLGALTAELPAERFIYFGDTLNAPYGTKTQAEVLRCVRDVFGILRGRQAKAVVIACNTATAVAAAALRAENPDFPIIGIEPALKPAAQMRHGGRILVLATPLTLQLEKFSRLFARWGDGAVPVPCPGLMELVERQDEAGARAYLADVLSAQGTAPLDAVVLGCTHYVFLRPLLREMLPPGTALLDGNAGTARQLRRVLAERGLLRTEGEGSVELCSSDGRTETIRLMETLLIQAAAVAAETGEENPPASLPFSGKIV